MDNLKSSDSDEDNKQKKPSFSINKSFKILIDSFLEKNEDLENITPIFEKWILDLIESSIFKTKESDFKLYDVFEMFNQILITQISKKDPSAGTKIEASKYYISLSSNFINILIKLAILDYRILKFLDSNEWNDVLSMYFEYETISIETIESLKTMVMLIGLMNIKIEKFKLKKGW